MSVVKASQPGTLSVAMCSVKSEVPTPVANHWVLVFLSKLSAYEQIIMFTVGDSKTYFFTFSTKSIVIISRLISQFHIANQATDTSAIR